MLHAHDIRDFLASAVGTAELVTSLAVVEELERGDLQAKEDCLALIATLPVVAIDEAILEIVQAYIRYRVMPATCPDPSCAGRGESRREDASPPFRQASPPTRIPPTTSDLATNEPARCQRARAAEKVGGGAVTRRHLRSRRPPTADRRPLPRRFRRSSFVSGNHRP